MKTILKTICIIIIFFTPSTLFAQKDTMVFIVDTKAPYVGYVQNKIKQNPSDSSITRIHNFYIGIKSGYIEEKYKKHVDGVIHLESDTLNYKTPKLKIHKSKLGQYALYTSEELNKFTSIKQCYEIGAVYIDNRNSYVLFKDDLTNEYITLYSVELSCNLIVE